MNSINYLHLLLIPIGSIFLWINYRIILFDIKYKKIPNKKLLQLIYILPLYYIILYLNNTNIFINSNIFLIDIFVCIIVTFTLFYFGVWAAGDAKYIITLFLFLPYVRFPIFIGNIIIVVSVYLILYFFWFYFYKLTTNKIYRKFFFKNLKIHLTGILEQYKRNYSENTLSLIIKLIIILLLIFVIIRLVKLCIFYGQNENKINYLTYIIQNLGIYPTIIILGILAWVLYFGWINLKKIYFFLIKKYNFLGKKNPKLNTLIILLLIILLTILLIEYYYSPETLKIYIIKIFTIYLLIYIIAKSLKFSYKLAFGLAEYKYIEINKLKPGNIIDKEYLIKLLGTQSILGYTNKDDQNNIEIINKRKKYIRYPSPKKHILKIENPIDKKTVNELKKIYSIVNKYHGKNDKNYKSINKVKIIKTFSFSIFIFIGFLISLLLNDFIFQQIIKLVIKL